LFVSQQQINQIRRFFSTAQTPDSVITPESALKSVKELGITITEEVEFEGAKFFFIRDPDKNVIEFHQPANS